MTNDRTGVFATTDETGISGQVTITEGEIQLRPGLVSPTLDAAYSKCGMDFGVLIRIIEPEGPAPLILVQRPIGVGDVKDFIEHCEGSPVYLQVPDR